MKRIKLTETEESPLVILDKNEGIFEFGGISIVDNGKEFYDEILHWVRSYSKDPNPETIVNFKMEYCNTASSKQLYEIMISFLHVEALGCKLTINWYYDSYDDDMEDLGNSFRKAAYEDLNVIPNPDSSED